MVGAEDPPGLCAKEFELARGGFCPHAVEGADVVACLVNDVVAEEIVEVGGSVTGECFHLMRSSDVSGVHAVC